MRTFSMMGKVLAAEVQMCMTGDRVGGEREVDCRGAKHHGRFDLVELRAAFGEQGFAFSEVEVHFPIPRQQLAISFGAGSHEVGRFVGANVVSLRQGRG